MPRTKYHAKLEQDRQLRQLAANKNNEETTVMTTNEVNGNGQILTTANLNKLASALGEKYIPETATVEELLFSEAPSNQVLADLAKTFGTTENHLANILINDSLTGNGDKAKLLRLIADDIKQQQLEQHKRLIEQQKQHLLNEVRSLDLELDKLAAGAIV